MMILMMTMMIIQFLMMKICKRKDIRIMENTRKKVVVDGVDVSEYAHFYENEEPFDLNDFETDDEEKSSENKGE